MEYSTRDSSAAGRACSCTVPLKHVVTSDVFTEIITVTGLPARHYLTAADVGINFWLLWETRGRVLRSYRVAGMTLLWTMRSSPR